jgi:divalent metal cation (Fe/Co/Zn/Cd) transporter
MTITDVFWVIAWFIVGLVVFQVKGVKSLFDLVSGIFSAFSLFLLLLKPDPLTEIFTAIGLGYISGAFTFIVYRIGANISRCIQFNEMSPKIVLYLLAFPVLLILEIKF